MDYVNPDALCETDWLAEKLGDPKIALLDASWHLPTIDRNAREEYEASHIPGAVFFDIDAVSDKGSDLPHMLPSPAAFARDVSAMGIGNGHHVIVYDSYGLFSAARVWWMFRAFGHDNVSLLNGGLLKWQAEGRPCESGQIQRPQAEFNASFRPELVNSIEDVQAVVAAGNRAILDARSAPRFFGEAPEPRAGLRGGHIPGSFNLPFDQLLDGTSKTLLPADRLKPLFSDVLDKGNGITCSCGTGVTACALALALHLIGETDVAVYDGSWTEWGGRTDTPVET